MLAMDEAAGIIPDRLEPHSPPAFWQDHGVITRDALLAQVCREGGNAKAGRALQAAAAAAFPDQGRAWRSVASLRAFVYRCCRLALPHDPARVAWLVAAFGVRGCFDANEGDGALPHAVLRRYGLAGGQAASRATPSTSSAAQWVWHLVAAMVVRYSALPFVCPRCPLPPQCMTMQDHRALRAAWDSPRAHYMKRVKRANHAKSGPQRPYHLARRVVYGLLRPPYRAGLGQERSLRLWLRVYIAGSASDACAPSGTWCDGCLAKHTLLWRLLAACLAHHVALPPWAWALPAGSPRRHALYLQGPPEHVSAFVQTLHALCASASDPLTTQVWRPLLWALRMVWRHARWLRRHATAWRAVGSALLRVVEHHYGCVRRAAGGEVAAPPEALLGLCHGSPAAVNGATEQCSMRRAAARALYTLLFLPLVDSRRTEVQAHVVVPQPSGILLGELMHYIRVDTATLWTPLCAGETSRIRLRCMRSVGSAVVSPLLHIPWDDGVPTPLYRQALFIPEPSPANAGETRSETTVAVPLLPWTATAPDAMIMPPPDRGVVPPAWRCLIGVDLMHCARAAAVVP